MSKDESVDPDLYVSNRHKRRSRKSEAAPSKEPAPVNPEEVRAETPSEIPEMLRDVMGKKMMDEIINSMGIGSTFFTTDPKRTINYHTFQTSSDAAAAAGCINYRVGGVSGGFTADFVDASAFVDYSDITQRTSQPKKRCKYCRGEMPPIGPPLSDMEARGAYIRGFCSLLCEVQENFYKYASEKQHEERRRQQAWRANFEAEQQRRLKKRWEPCAYKQEFFRRRFGSAITIKTGKTDWERYVGLEEFLEWLRTHYQKIQHRYQNPPSLDKATEERLRHIHAHQPAKVWRLAILDMLAEIDAA